MSGPLVVNTKDGAVWTRRGTLRGEPLYALHSAVCGCPEFVMVTLADLAELGIVGSADVLPVPVGPRAPESYPPALPWAALMDDEDLREFLGDLIDALNSTPATGRSVLAEVEKTCATWRLIAEAQHGHNTAPGPDAMTRTFAPPQAFREVPRDEDVTPQVQKLRALLAGQRAAAEDPHDGPLAHTYRVGRDLPETGGVK